MMFATFKNLDRAGKLKDRGTSATRSKNIKVFKYTYIVTLMYTESEQNFYHFPLAPPPPVPQDELLLSPLLLLLHDLPESLVNDLSQPFEDADAADKLPVAVTYHVADGSLPLKTEGTSTLFASLAGCISQKM